MPGRGESCGSKRRRGPSYLLAQRHALHDHCRRRPSPSLSPCSSSRCECIGSSLPVKREPLACRPVLVCLPCRCGNDLAYPLSSAWGHVGPTHQSLLTTVFL